MAFHYELVHEDRERRGEKTVARKPGKAGASGDFRADEKRNEGLIKKAL